MYLPTFWKLSSEVYMYKAAKVAGWGLPAACMGKCLQNSVERASNPSSRAVRAIISHPMLL